MHIVINSLCVVKLVRLNLNKAVQLIVRVDLDTR